MSAPFKFLKTALIAGALVVLPAWLAVLLLLQILFKLEAIVKPISVALPDNIIHPLLIALVVLLLICFIVGALIQTVFGLNIKNRAETAILAKIPGYTMIRGLASQIGDLEDKNGFEPALVEIEEALAPCFIIERHEGGLCTVFIPSAPTPAAGSILIIACSRVHPINVPVTKLFKCVTKWGTGSGELLAALPKPESP
jgi:uncharacterized membrane protein